MISLLSNLFVQLLMMLKFTDLVQVLKYERALLSIIIIYYQQSYKCTSEKQNKELNRVQEISDHQTNMYTST
jgi:hypothetical protein